MYMYTATETIGLPQRDSSGGRSPDHKTKHHLDLLAEPESYMWTVFLSLSLRPDPQQASELIEGRPGIAHWVLGSSLICFVKNLISPFLLLN